MTGPPVASVIICTRNRAASLGVTLASLASEGSTTPWELILVDNGSTDETRHVTSLRSVGRELTPLRVDKPGHNRALNAAVDVARGEFLLFTDDDVTIEAGWVDALVSAFELDVAAVAGRIIPVLEGDRPSWMGPEFEQQFPAITLRDRGTLPYTMVGADLPTGANMAVRRDLLGAGRFDLHFGPTGKANLAYGEAELLRRIRDDRRYIYEPAAVVRHRVSLERLTFENVRSRLFQTGFGAARYRNRVERIPALPRRLVHASRSYRRALSARVRPVTAESAVTELAAWYQAGQDIETLVAFSPRLGRRLSVLLA